MMERLLRGVAMAIAVLAFIDPVVEMSRPVAPLISLVQSGEDSLAFHRARALLRNDFTVVEGAMGASATVIAGPVLPPRVAALSAPVVAVVPDADGLPLRISALDVPTEVPLGARTVATLAVERPARSAPLDTIVVQLASDNVLLAETRTAAGEGSVRVEVPYVPTATGIHRLQFDATLRRNGAVAGRAQAERHVHVKDARIEVLVADARVSWMSTFVRRALEGDARFSTRSRVSTSRGIALSSGNAPAAEMLAQWTPDSLDAFDVVIVGAPDAATPATARALERYMRVRGGVVLLLFDNVGATPFDHVIGHGAWRALALASPGAVRRVGDTARLLSVSEYIAPVATPAGAAIIATVTRSDRNDPVLFHVPVGAGRLVVAGTLDAWRYREREQSSFMQAWPDIVADLSVLALPPLMVFAEPRVVAPGDEVVVQVAVRDAMLTADNGSWSGQVSSMVQWNDHRQPVALYPTRQPGVFEGRFRASSAFGPAALFTSVDSDGPRAQQLVPLLVGQPGPQPVQVDELLPLWAAAHGGFTVTHAGLPELPARLLALVGAEVRPVPVHPMRSPWWIVPFALALGGEWWLRRRRGRA